MGAWIEIEQMKGMRQGLFGRTPRWVRGLKLETGNQAYIDSGRTPRWVRGLKYDTSL